MLKNRRTTLIAALLLGMAPVFMQLGPPGGGLAAEPGPTVFAAASLKSALDRVAADWQEKTGRKPVIAYAATSALAKHITQGAEAEIFISADEGWMDYLADRGLIERESRFNLLGNRLALVAPKDSPIDLAAEPGMPLGAHLGEGRLAIAGTDAVPAGKYAKAALQSLGVWDAVKTRLAQADNVRAALRLVARGETPLGIVYASDAAAEPAVRIVSLFPETSHPPIVYPAARLKGTESAESNLFLNHLKSPGAAARFEALGFGAPSKAVGR